MTIGLIRTEGADGAGGFGGKGESAESTGRTSPAEAEEDEVAPITGGFGLNAARIRGLR